MKMTLQKIISSPASCYLRAVHSHHHLDRMMMWTRIVILLFVHCSYSQSSPENGTVRSCRGVDGSQCFFPFDYYGTVYYACIKEEDDFIDPWCATSVGSNNEYEGNWEECNSDCPVCKTVDSK